MAGRDVVYMLRRVVRGRFGGKVMLPKERKDCVWVKKNMGVLEVLRIAEEAMGEGIRGQRMWYSLKCNQLDLLPLGRDGDVKKLMKGNDEYTYLYVVGSEGPCVQRKLGLKVDNQKMELEKWKNSVGDRIEKKLRKTLGTIGSVVDIKLFNTAHGEYSVLLMNNHSLVGLLCTHAMAVIDKQNLWVYDYVSDCYKAGGQNTIYMNSLHPMETHDSATVDNAMGLVIGGEALDDGYN
ncbi:hypothetical protein Cgig2_033871 [Carnegiea gigantea]|uniref:Uncharacterized protein n=1 Tax=Carnegiea gigantea TaxID=171969 RepID=A0A9Q1JWZ2_9CARY|nr:hypothetical protein Cgig2_033871 [Carnegiea gigantea]